MPILIEPVPSATLAQLRHTLLRFREGQPRRIFPTRIFVGDPDGARAWFEVPERSPRASRGGRTLPMALDASHRADVVGALLDRWLSAELAVPPLLWVIRSGVIDGIHEIDAAWLAAGHHAFAECRVELTMVVFTRQGWTDPRSGVGRRWKRLRVH